MYTTLHYTSRGLSQIEYRELEPSSELSQNPPNTMMINSYVQKKQIFEFNEMINKVQEPKSLRIRQHNE